MVWKGRSVHTGIWKNPVTGRCRVGRLNLEGDGQGDLAGHGGEHRAVFVYQIESYRYWREQLNRSDFVYGQFGENFTIEGLAGDAVCIAAIDFRSAPHFSRSARRAEVLFCSRESDRSYCSVPGSARHPLWRCCTHSRRHTRRVRSSGCTQHVIGSIIRLPSKSAASCER
jgi:MOSC domain